MRLIKILIETEDQADEIFTASAIGEFEANGLLDFPFTVRITDELTPSEAKHNFHTED
jgi:hypothetical protein